MGYNKMFKYLKKSTVHNIQNGRWVHGSLTNYNSVKQHMVKTKRSFFKKLPDSIFIVDLKKNMPILKEANSLGIPTIGIGDTDSNIKNLTYILPGNDDSYEV